MLMTTLPEPYGSDPLTPNRVIVKDSAAVLKEYPRLYAAGTEELAQEEMRITALGTGYPARRGQGCAGFMAELGNGEVFIFDAGAGTNSSFNHMAVPYGKATRFFITHYHIDHIADLLVYYDFGQSNGRLDPMNIYGPAGEREEWGIEALVDNLYRLAGWHDKTKKGNVDPRGFEMVPHQFVPDRSQVVYDSNGVVVTAFPVPHGMYGAVGYRLDYAGMSMVFAGDCEPSTITVDNAQNVDLIIHEVFNPPETYVEKLGWTEHMAKIVAWTKHTSPEAAAEVFSRTNPRLAMSYHSMIAPGTPQPLYDGIRSGFQGPVVVGQDFTVVNITPEQIVTRMVDYVPWSFIVSDPEYLQSKGGAQQDPSQHAGQVPQWLDDTIIQLPMIEAFKEELRRQGMR
jgi:ribonuclease Z